MTSTDVLSELFEYGSPVLPPRGRPSLFEPIKDQVKIHHLLSAEEIYQLIVRSTLYLLPVEQSPVRALYSKSAYRMQAVDAVNMTKNILDDIRYTMVAIIDHRYWLEVYRLMSQYPVTDERYNLRYYVALVKHHKKMDFLSDGLVDERIRQTIQGSLHINGGLAILYQHGPLPILEGQPQQEEEKPQPQQPVQPQRRPTQR